MKWAFRSLMAASVIGASLITAGILPLTFAAVFTATGVAAGFFHDSPNQTKSNTSN